jgi:hypothetical protein
MNIETENPVKSTSMSEKDFARLSKFIQSVCGIKMPESKSCLRQGSKEG